MNVGSASTGIASTPTFQCVRGALIVLEGGDRCGKSTQVKLMLQKLHQLKIPSLAMHFPGKFKDNPNKQIGPLLLVKPSTII
ncbi:hypothetical protein HMI56_004694 [Coelomomyces lativittatus]|nr:hypothetical protein HMI56_004694 [Coelomomyces lativittatus]